MAQGKRRYDRKQSGYGGQTKPVFHKKAKTVSTNRVESPCERIANRQCSFHDGMDARVDQEGRPSIGVLFLQGQEAARPQAMQAVRTTIFPQARLVHVPRAYTCTFRALQLRVGRREEDPWCRLDLLNVSPLITRRGSLKFRDPTRHTPERGCSFFWMSGEGGKLWNMPIFLFLIPFLHLLPICALCPAAFRCARNIPGVMC